VPQLTQSEITEQALTATFAALADPIRRSLLAQLTRGEATVGELAGPHEVSLPAISRHLKVLEAAGLVTKSVRAQWRTCRIDPAGLQRADEWMAPYREFFDTKFDQLEQHLKTMVAERDRKENGS
jgi:DNA-binding transcriptional ArsR family regulator